MLSKLESIPVHFILCTERSGSSLLSLMLNLNSKITSPSEEPFAVFFYQKYKDKISWTENELKHFIEEFWLISEKNLELFFTTKEKLFNSLILYKDNLSYSNLIKLIYLNFFEPKDKSEVSVIVDKQIKYFFYLPALIKIFPDAKFIILVRDVRDNIISKSNRNLNSSSNPIYLSSLWKNTYNQIHYLIKKQKPVLVIKYEELIYEPKKKLEQICQFLRVDFQPSMLETEGKYQLFLDIKKTDGNATEITRLETFQSNLFKPVNDSHIGSFVNKLDKQVLAKIEKLNSELFNFLNYNIVSDINVNFSISDHYQMLKAYLYRPLLLDIYLKIPLSIKLFIKRVRKK